jgi:hypothetical protein
MSPGSPAIGHPPPAPAEDRLESWKEIASYLNREVRTVQRWERERGLPVSRVPGSQRGGVYASRRDLDEWLNQKRTEVVLTRGEVPVSPVLHEPVMLPAPSVLAAIWKAILSAPWQLFAAAVPCLFYTVVTWYIHLGGPEPPGWIATPTANGFLVETVGPGTPAARCGLAAGDRIVEWGGRPLYGFIRLPLIHAAPGRTYQLTIERERVRQYGSLVFGRKGRNVWSHRDGLTEIAFLLCATLYLGLGLFIVFSRPQSAAARWGAVCLCAGGICLMHMTSFVGTYGAFHLVRELPPPLGRLFLAVIAAASGILPAALIRFLCIFPGTLFRNRAFWAAIWTLNLARSGVLMYWWIFLTFSPEAFQGFGWTANVGDTAIFPQFLGAIAILGWNTWSLKQADLRRRARVMMAGLGVSLIAALPGSIFGVAAFPVVRRLTPAYEASWVPLILSFFYPAFPAAVAYAILRHRLFDIRVIVRKGIQYGAARNILLALGPVAAAVLVADLWLRRNQRLADILHQRLWLYAAVAACCLVLQWKKSAWLWKLDRRFFREQYDARKILYAVSAEARRVGTLEQAAPHAVAQIDAAIHPEFAAILIKAAGQTTFQAKAAVRLVPAPIPAASKLVTLVRVLGKPIEIPSSEDECLGRGLPPEEVELLRGTKPEWIFPIAVGEEQAEALLVLGSKRSEEPYSAEDRILLEAVAANLALLSLEPVPAKAVPY